MEVLAVTTLLLLTVPVRRNKTKHDDKNEDSHRAYVKRVMVLVCSHQFCRLCWGLLPRTRSWSALLGDRCWVGGPLS